MSAPITCHVLNTVSGTPAAGLKATLSLLEVTNSDEPTKLNSTVTFEATTDNDGRIKDWGLMGVTSLPGLMENYEDGDRVPFSIRFEIGSWYEAKGIETFWPEVEIKFYVKKGERHYHVPCLVGPWTYTTYRGS